MHRSLIAACFSMLAVCAATSAVAEELRPEPSPALTVEPSLAPRTTPTSPSSPGPAPSIVRSLPRPGAAPRVQLAPLGDARLTNQTRQALAFYGGYSARATLSQLPRRTPVQSAAPQPMQSQLKPFQTLDADPTLSPYLHLDREETADDLPNYFTFVRPQFQQRDANLAQHRELQRLQRQLNSVSATVVSPRHGPASAPVTGTPARFMDTAQFYGGWRR